MFLSLWLGGFDGFRAAQPILRSVSGCLVGWVERSETHQWQAVAVRYDVPVIMFRQGLMGFALLNPSYGLRPVTL